MPFKSKAQQRAMHAMAARGEISKKTVAKFDKATEKQPGGFKALPEKKSAFQLGLEKGAAGGALRAPFVIAKKLLGQGGRKALTNAGAKLNALSPDLKGAGIGGALGFLGSDSEDGLFNTAFNVAGGAGLGRWIGPYAAPHVAKGMQSLKPHLASLVARR